MVLLVVNALHMRNVPGRKTDMKDAEWSAKLLCSALMDGNFIFSRPVRELCNLTRYRKTVVEDVNSHKNRLEKFLQSAGFKLSTSCSDVFGVSGRAIMEHLAELSSISPSQVESLLKGRLRGKREEIALATRGSLTELQQDFLGILLTHLYQIEANILEIDRRIDIVAFKFQQQLEQLDSIPGIDKVAAQTVLAEIRTDIERFKTAAHICSWAGLSPGNNESAGKKVCSHHQGKPLHQEGTL